MDKQTKIIRSAVVSIFLVIISYIILHESGHYLVAVYCGAEITKFSILGAHMSYSGGTFSPVTYAFFHAGGMLLPVLTSFVFMLFYSKNCQKTFYRIFSFMFSLIPFFSLIAWVFVPILYLSGKAPKGDDVTKFLTSSGINPWVVCLAATILFACGVLFAWKKKIIQNYLETCKSQDSKV